MGIRMKGGGGQGCTWPSGKQSSTPSKNDPKLLHVLSGALNLNWGFQYVPVYIFFYFEEGEGGGWDFTESL